MGIVLVSLLQSTPQQRPRNVNLTVIRDGHEVAAPTEITVSFGGRSLRIPVRKGRFEVPPGVVAARRLLLQADVGGDHIRFTHLTGMDFTDQDWTLRLAERADDDYDWGGPKGADIATTCTLEFESPNEDPGRVQFEEHCRSKKK
jgi:hypothetical protein